MLCKAGPARLRPHRALQRRLGQLLTSAGANVDYERPVPDFYRLRTDGSVQDAILDIVATFPGDVCYHAIDVSIRAPQASRYADTATRAGVPSSTGSAEKVRRYGTDVLPIVFEPGGRVCDNGLAALQKLSTAAAATNMRSEGGRPLWQKWRMHLECALQFALADIILLGVGHPASTLCPGRRVVRPALSGPARGCGTGRDASGALRDGVPAVPAVRPLVEGVPTRIPASSSSARAVGGGDQDNGISACCARADLPHAVPRAGVGL